MTNFFKSIKFKIVLAFGLCIALLIANGALGVVGLTRLSSDMSELYRGNTTPIAQLGTVRFARAGVSLMAVRAQNSEDAAERKKLAEMIHAEQEELNAFWNAYYPVGINSAEERVVADKLVPLLKDFNQQITVILAALKTDDSESLNNAIAVMLKEGDEIGVLLRQNAQINLDLARQFAEEGEATASFLIGAALSLAVIGLLIGLTAIVYLVRAITRPLGKALSVANNIAEGKLENKVVNDTQDEFGQLLDSLQRMDAQLAGIVREIKTSTESVSVASREIASGNLDLSSRTEQQAASLEETAASMTQLTETVKQNADNARQANTMASDATGMAEAGDSSVQAMISTVGKLSDSSTKISEITGFIEGIAFQTNILALNAAVEAARAGEQGRGFAVVASEVRTLAQRSSAAAKEIKVLIDASVTMAKDGSRQAEDVGVTMSKVKLGIKHVSDIVNEISKASAEQSQGIEQVHHAIAQMDDVTQQNAALVEEAAAAAQSLEEQADKLKDSVSVFRVRDREVLDNVPVSLGSHS